jgi:gamma-F420-2:alpha-L-glutamate ligase
LSEELLQKYPAHVIKAADGHGGAQVFQTQESFEIIRHGIGSSDFVIQPFVEGPGRDVRVYVIGNEIVGAVERTAVAGGFRSNFSLGGSVKNYALRDADIRLVDKVCRLFSFGMAGIDFIVDKNNDFVFNEIEDVVGARMLYECNPDVKLLEKYFAFILDKILH